MPSAANYEAGFGPDFYSSARYERTRIFQYVSAQGGRACCWTHEIIRAIRSSAQSLSQPPSGEIAIRSSSADPSQGASVRPFAALQNLASLVPLSSPFSWSGMRGASFECTSTGESNNDRSKAEEQKKGFVSKERQLARLRQRMAAEENTILVEAQTRVVKQQRSVSLLPCKRCVDRVVAP